MCLEALVPGFSMADTLIGKAMREEGALRVMKRFGNDTLKVFKEIYKQESIQKLPKQIGAEIGK